MTDQNQIDLQINGAKNTFFGILKGFDGKVKINIPNYVYHYTTLENFKSIINSQTIRLYTINNFEDKLERKFEFPIEKRVQGTITNNVNGEKFDFKTFVNSELSNDHVFIQSNSASQYNKYLWNNYANKGKGICLKLATRKFINYLNDYLEDFELLPEYFKCCYISYDNKWVTKFMETLFSAINDTNIAGGAGKIVWFFFLEYWRNFIKSKPYSSEEEIRFVISDNYSLFLLFCSLLCKWGCFITNDNLILEMAFYSEYERRKNNIGNLLNLNQIDGKKFVSIPLYEVLDSIVIGPKAKISKDDISILSKRLIRKSRIRKSSLVLNL